jgi:hypothetical protein
MGSTLRHVFDSGVTPWTLIVLALLALQIYTATRGNKQRVRAVVTLLGAVLLLADLPYDASLLKRSGVLTPLFQAVLGRDEL